VSAKHTPNPRSRNVMQRIRKLRQARGWSGTELADRMARIGMPIAATTLRSYETGRRRDVTTDELFAFAEVFGTTPQALVEPVACDTCHGAPPKGFECRACGAISGDTQEA
jgi:transcriptional regulator with XRE-family HTH domain